MRRLGRGIRVTSATPDGVAEMLEVPSKRFVVGLQWHPERPDVSDSGDKVADALVHAARTRRATLSGCRRRTPGSRPDGDAARAGGGPPSITSAA